MAKKKAARPARRSLWATAYHEAGHAVAAFVLGLRIGRRGVTIVPNYDWDGSAHVLKQLREKPDTGVAPRTQVRIERFVMMCLAGDTAQRKYAPCKK